MLTALIVLSLAIYVGGAAAFLVGLNRPHRATNRETPLVTVVVAARNEAERLPGLLADLSAQTYPNLEVFIVDDRSTDRTAELVRTAEHAQPERFRLIRQTDVPPGDSPKKSALQRGIEAGTGEIVLLTDADCRVRPTWVAGMVRAFTPDVGLVLGYSELTARDPRSPFEGFQAFEFHTLVATMAASANLGHGFGASGQNIGFRRSTFNLVGGYRSVMHRLAGDDMLMLELVRTTPGAGRVVFSDDPETRNRTFAEPSWWAFRSQRTRWAANGTHHFRRDRVFLGYALAALVVNMTALFGWGWAWSRWTTWPVWIGCVGLKLIADVAFFGSAARRFGRADLRRWLPVWFVAQPIYLLALAVWGQRGRFTWKP